MHQLKTPLILLFIGLISIGCRQQSNKNRPLQITGIITSIETITFVSTANSGTIRQEVRIFIDLKNATDYNGDRVIPNSHDSPYFVSKDLTLYTKFKKGNTVKIVVPSTSKKHIKTIEIIN